MAKKRGRETARDMLLSLGVIFATVLVILVITWRPRDAYIPSVDFEDAKLNALATATWPIYIPSEIPSELTVTSARLEAENLGEPGDSRWYLGLTGQDDQFISLWQSDGNFKKISDAATNSGNCTEQIELLNVTWEKCFSPNPETRSLISIDGEVITIISGTAEWKDLENFVNSLVITN